MRMAMAMTLVSGLLVGGSTQAADGDEALDGEWTLTSGEADGKALGNDHLKDGKLILKGETYKVKLAGRDAVAGKQKTDPSKNPKTIDIADTEGANAGKVCLGLYELKGDEFRVVFAPPGKPRPTKFSTEAGTGEWVHVWKRVKP